MKIDVINYKKYKKYLADKVDHDSKLTKGLRLKLCDHIGCQPSYLSQVLNGNPQFTLEQAHLINSFFMHNKLEAKYFLLLVQMERAGTKNLKDFFSEQIEEILESRFDLKKRLKETDEIPDEARHRYYSTWYYSAIHIILAIPEFQDIDSIAKRFNLPPQIVKDAIQFLDETGLIKSEKGVYVLTNKTIHLERNSVFIHQHHINWRSQALQSAEKNLPTDMHYSNTCSIARKDFPKIKEIFLKAIEDARTVIRPSKDEELYAITLDVFNV
ncbi:MAG: TIGR02147 family protein [Bdellovibrionota bacterium]